MAKRKYTVKGTNDFIVLAAIFFFLCLWAIKDAWFPSEKVLNKHPRQVEASFQVAGTVDEVLVAVGDSIGEDQVIARLREDRARQEYKEATEAYTAARNKHTMLEVSLKNMREAGASEGGAAEIEQKLAEAKTAMDEASADVKRLNTTLEHCGLKSPKKGKVLELRAGSHTMVDVLAADIDGVVDRVGKSSIKLVGKDGTEKSYDVPEDYNVLRESGDAVAAGDALASETVLTIKPADHFYLFNKSLAVFSFFGFWIFLAVHLLGR